VKVGRKPPVADLLVQLTKREDGSVVLRCTRADGSATWQRQDGPRARFFALHDLAHYAVETILEAREGFYGLIAAGWDIPETEGKSARGPLPAETTAIEHLVGMLDGERAGGVAASASEFNDHAIAYATRAGRPAPAVLTDEQLPQIRTLIETLHGRWRELRNGETLELSFPSPRSQMDITQRDHSSS